MSSFESFPLAVGTKDTPRRAPPQYVSSLLLKYLQLEGV